MVPWLPHLHKIYEDYFQYFHYLSVGPTTLGSKRWLTFKRTPSKVHYRAEKTI